MPDWSEGARRYADLELMVPGFLDGGTYTCIRSRLPTVELLSAWSNKFEEIAGSYPLSAAGSLDLLTDQSVLDTGYALQMRDAELFRLFEPWSSQGSERTVQLRMDDLGASGVCVYWNSALSVVELSRWHGTTSSTVRLDELAAGSELPSDVNGILPLNFWQVAQLKNIPLAAVGLAVADILVGGVSLASLVDSLWYLVQFPPEASVGSAVPSRDSENNPPTQEEFVSAVRHATLEARRSVSAVLVEELITRFDFAQYPLVLEVATKIAHRSEVTYSDDLLRIASELADRVDTNDSRFQYSVDYQLSQAVNFIVGQAFEQTLLDNDIAFLRIWRNAENSLGQDWSAFKIRLWQVLHGS